MTGASAWLWPALSAALALVGITLGAWALFWDRSRGRARCPRCWYDMSGHLASAAGGTGLSPLRVASGDRPVRTPSAPTEPQHTCPECGHAAKREKRLYKTRRKRKLAAFGVLLALSPLGISAGRAVHRDGWSALVPTILLIEALPWLDAEWDETPAVSKAESAPLAALGYKLLLDRITQEGVARWEWDRLVNRALAGDGGAPPRSDRWRAKYFRILDIYASWHIASEVQIRRMREATWELDFMVNRVFPGEAPIYAEPHAYSLTWSYPERMRYRMNSRTPGVPDHVEELRGPAWGSHDPGSLQPWHDDLIVLGFPTSGADRIEYDVTVEIERLRELPAPEPEPRGRDDIFDNSWPEPEYEHLGWQNLGTFRMEIPVERAALGQAIVPVESDLLSDQMRSIPYELLRSQQAEGPVAMLVFDAPVLRTPVWTGLTIAVQLELLRDGQCVAHGFLWQRTESADWKWMAPDGNCIDLVPTSDRLWDPDERESTWLVCVTGDPAVAARDPWARMYWKGSVLIPVEVPPMER